MFGRFKRAHHDGEQQADPTTTDVADAEVVLAEGQTLVAEHTAPSETAPTDVSPIRDAAIDDSGLAAIESEFTLNDNDRSLLSTPSIGLEVPLPPLSAVDSTIAEHRSQLDDFVTRLNAEWTQRLGAPTSLRPYFLIPERCWDSEHREVLVELLGLAPAQPWNVLPLPCDTATAATLGVPEHPGNSASEVADVASPFIDEAIERMQAQFERATFGSDTVDTAALDAARTQASSDIQALAARMGHAVLGEGAIATTRGRFFGS